MSNPMKQMLAPARSRMLDGVIDDRHDDAGQEEISPMFLDPWNTGSHFTPIPTKPMDFTGIPQYMDYHSLGNVSY